MMNWRIFRSVSLMNLVVFLTVALAGSFVALPANAGLIDQVSQFTDVLPKEIYQPFKPKQAPDLYGPTAINATLGNQGLSVAVRENGTISTFSWPRPSMYNQVKYHTDDRTKDGEFELKKFGQTRTIPEQYGAAENSGLFLGLSYYEEECKFFGLVCSWKVKDYSLLKDDSWNVSQDYYGSDNLNDVVVTEFTNSNKGLKVTVTDFVPINENVTTGLDGQKGTYTGYGSGEVLDGDALIRKVDIQEIGGGFAHERLKLFSYANFNMTRNHHPYVPTSDWAEPLTKSQDAYYEDNQNGTDAIFHFDEDRRNGNNPKQVIAMGFGDGNNDHKGHVGYDNIACINVADFDCWANFVINGSMALVQNNANGAYHRFENNGELGDAVWTNHANNCITNFGGLGWCPTLRDFFTSTGMMSERLDPSNNPTEHVIFTAANQDNSQNPKQKAANLLKSARGMATNSTQWNNAIAAKKNWYKHLLQGSPIPTNASQDVVELSKRSLVTLAQYYDPHDGINSNNGGAIVASIARQSPYAEDWPRDGAYFNYVLDHKMGLHDWVENRNYWYADLQQKPDAQFPNDFPNQPLVPAGNWAMNYYGNGVEGGVIPWEIDETGYMVWAFWDHYQATNDMQYLQNIYPALKRSADFLVNFKDQSNGLQKPAHEDDNFGKTQTLLGANTTYLAMKAAEQAANTLGNTADANKYAQRKNELEQAINTQLWNNQRNAWGIDKVGMAEIAWPTKFRNWNHPRMQGHLETTWNKTKDVYKLPNGGNPAQFENKYGIPKGLYQTKDLIAQAKGWQGTSKMSRVHDGLNWVASKWATDNTDIVGEVWLIENGEVKSTVSQPHAWEQALFYIAATEAYSTSPIQ